jgi:integrase
MSRSSRSANGRSSIYRGADGTWHGWVSMGRDENDNPVRRHVRGRTRLTVTDKVAALENQRAKGAGRSATNSRQTVGGWLDEWLLLVRRSRKARTFTTYDSLVRTHCAGIRTTPLNRLTIRQLDDLLNHVATTVSPTSAANLHRTLRAAFSVAVRRALTGSGWCG